jgi:hypothetical protein
MAQPSHCKRLQKALTTQRHTPNCGSRTGHDTHGLVASFQLAQKVATPKTIFFWLLYSKTIQLSILRYYLKGRLYNFQLFCNFYNPTILHKLYIFDVLSHSHNAHKHYAKTSFLIYKPMPPFALVDFFLLRKIK